MKDVKIVDLKEYNSKEVGLLVQIVLIEILLIFAVLTLIVSEFLNAFYIILSLVMFTMAYNNKKFYKKKYMTGIYTIVGFFVFVSTIVEYIF